MSLVDDLKRQILLDGIEGAELEKIAGMVDTFKVSKGDPIFRENEQTRGIYMINTGEVEITKKLPIDLKTKMLITMRNMQNCCQIRKTPFGWRQLFASLIEGQYFGELSVIEGKKKHGADADAVTDCEFYLLSPDKFAVIEATSPETILKMLKTIARVSSKNLRYLDRQLLKLLIGI
ncbi:MAG: cyclic nucleotide-binding domain-containing protein [Nitrospirae bacterium]|nr:cyclic nucleotide-binding domain-containing protein [Nitrospirota bacterium]MBF0534245.1 cyclic nucleotide-binding domain-containing protein [Nitrospirota bacterium]MBF0615841.1 cyclic nucleotide-binding domain-containing protein [Nitrospirota bacterium]